MPEDSQAHVLGLHAMPNCTSMGKHTFLSNLVERETTLVNDEVFNSVGDQSTVEISFEAKVKALHLSIVPNHGAGDCLFLAVLQHFCLVPSSFMVQDLRIKVSSSHFYKCAHDPLQEHSTTLIKFQKYYVGLGHRRTSIQMARRGR